MPVRALCTSLPLRRNIARLAFAGGLAGCFAGAALAAGVFPLDDSASVVMAPVSQLKWRTPGPGARRDAMADAATQVQLVLNTQPWLGKHARIYMLLAPQPVRVTVRWTTRGVLLPGTLQSGGRVLVFEGNVPLSLRERLDVIVSADGRELGAAQRLQFSYEIEPL